jgi:putative transposase
MIDRAEGPSVVRQCRLLDVGRSTAYYTAAGVTQVDLDLMRLIDEVHLKHPFYGSRRLRDWLHDQGYRVNRKKVQRLMRQMGLVALYPKRNTSSAQPGASRVSVSAAGPTDCPTQSGLGSGCDL